MTCIVGLKAQGKVWMGGDSAGVTGDTVSIRKDPKVFRRGDLLIGYTASFRMGQILRYNPLAALIPEADAMEWMVRCFIPGVRLLFETHGYVKREGEYHVGGDFLVGVSGRLFAVQSDFQVAESADDFDSVGCGAQIAKGAMYSSRFIDEIEPDQRVRLALAASERYSAGVRGPFSILSL